ncbi:MAG: ATP-binding protein [Chloroflexota bacterium]
MFLNREYELAQLQRWWDDTEPELITMYGRRQVGKTELLVQFLGGKRHLYFYADRQLLADQLRTLTEQVLALDDDPVLRLQPFTSWEAALTYVFRLAQGQRLGLVIDEFSYAVDADPSLPSVLQRLWDSARRAHTQVYLVLCTSFTDAVERHFTIDGALYRRRTRELRVEPFTYESAMLFFPRWSLVERVLAWGIVGGVPSYLQALRGETLAEAAMEHILDKSAILYREAETLLAQEVRGIGPALLRGMLQAIAYGCSEPNQIAQRIGRPVTALSGALGFLVDYGLIQRRIPFTVPNPERTRQTRYVIADNYLTFWFRFVLPNRSSLEQRQPEYVWRTRIVPLLDDYMGPRFEELCRQFIRLHPDRWIEQMGELGVWWRADEELEIVGHAQGRVTLAAEVKWTKDRVGLDVLHTLQRRVALLPNVADDCQLVLFSRNGFTRAVETAENSSLLLFTLGDLLVNFPSPPSGRHRRG